VASIVGFGKYSAQGAAGVLRNGFASRKQTLAAMAKEFGGEQQGYWVVGDVRWDFMFMWSLPDEALLAARAAFLAAQASGGFDASETFILLDAEAVDAARGSMPGYRPPNA
jgi:hypothetical protein